MASLNWTSCDEGAMPSWAETDWLASDPIFYNDKTAQISRNINDVIDFGNLEIDGEGFNNYLDYGYCVFGQTPVRHVKILRWSSRIRKDERRNLLIEHLPDPVEGLLHVTEDEKDVQDAIRDRVQAWESTTEGNLVIPTSSGYDSRLLNLLVREKQRIMSFTYGVSLPQRESVDVSYACRISEILGTRWSFVPLQGIHAHFEDWDKGFGPSTHAHGMYHLEFYNRVLQEVGSGRPLLSGIIGDAWAGAVDIPPIRGLADLILLGHTHGLHADSRMSLVPRTRELATAYWDRNRCRLEDPLFRIVEAMRFKLVLLCFLMRVPLRLGFHPYSPFLEIGIAMGMLNIPPDRRANRLWQRDLFLRHRLDLESQNIKGDTSNRLNAHMLRQDRLSPLDEEVLREVVRPEYLQWINREVSRAGLLWDGVRGLCNLVPPKKRHIVWRLGNNTSLSEAYAAYLTLRPIEKLLKRRGLSSYPLVEVTDSKPVGC